MLQMHCQCQASRRTFWKFLFVLCLACCIPAKALNTIFGNTKPKITNNKRAFLDSLDTVNGINAATRERTTLLQALLGDNPTRRPGAFSSFRPIAPGTWVVVYAPHITTMARLLGNSQFDPILYQMRRDGTMTSHVRWILAEIACCWLSVSGTYASRDEDRVCRVDFDQAWVKWNVHPEDEAYPTLQDVPSSLGKIAIQTIGKWGFVESFSAFPVAYLDDDLIVFDFELLGTRICARKIL